MKKFKVNIIVIILFCFHCLETEAQCVDDSNYWIESWTSCNISTNPNTTRGNSYWLLFEFTEPQAISTTHFWNANRVGESGVGAKTVFIDVSVDGSTWTQVGSSSYNWPQGSELENYEGFPGPDLKSFGFIEKILITIIDNHDNSNCVSISEMRFDIDPDACYGEFDDCGICNGTGPMLYFEDADDDGLGNPNSSIEACELPSGYVENNNDNCDNGLLSWNDIAYIFSENGCTGCHNGPGGSGNLDLTSFEGISNGGTLCGPAILTGSVLVDIISISNYDGCSSTIPFPSMNERVGGAIDNSELLLLQSWVDGGALIDCNCPDGAPDIDQDGVCDASDLCNGLDDALIGTPCDDGDPCTISDVFVANCKCLGMTAPDSDFDGVCDELDLAPDNPCTADGVVGLPEPVDWFANENNDCDLDGFLVSLGDLNDFDECINDKGNSLQPDCACPGNVSLGGPVFVDQIGVVNANSAGGKPDSSLTNGIGYKDYIDLAFPYLEIGTEICFVVGFSDPVGGIQFEVNDLGFYRFENPNPVLHNYELQTICFPTFVAGPQNIRASRFIKGATRIDGATYEYCPCTNSDINNTLTACKCPNEFSGEDGLYNSSSGISNAEAANGAPDGIFTGNIWSNDSLILMYPAQSENYEICIDILFSEINGKVSLDLNNENKTFVNPTGIGEINEVQTICFETNSNESQTLIIQEIGPGSIKIDGSISKYCNPCVADTDQDGVCDINDLCPEGDDSMDQDGDGIPDACDSCNGNLVGKHCDDFDNCTYFDTYDANCNCVGSPIFHDYVHNLNGVQSLTTIDSITLSGDFEIFSNGYYQAGQSITILPGFETKQFMTLEIQIDDCSSSN